MRGKLITLYAINNVGKSTQAKILVENLSKRAGLRAQYLKYARYELHPSGSHLNDYLRNGNPHNFSAREFQLLQILNRTQYQEELNAILDDGFWIVAEDYVGTGIAWGMAAGVERDLLVDLNRHLLCEDLAIYLHGKRHHEAIEKNHAHEGNSELMQQALNAHEHLSDHLAWTSISADGTVDEVSDRIWDSVHSILPKTKGGHK